MNSDGDATRQLLKDIEYDKMKDEQKRYAQVQAGINNEKRRGLSFNSLTDAEKEVGKRITGRRMKR